MRGADLLIERWGLLYSPPGTGMAVSHAQNPFPQRLSDDQTRIHFAARDSHNRARGYAVDFSAFELVPGSDAFKDGDLSRALIGPTLDLGALGAFDDCGVMPSCIVERDDEIWMYYTGWSKAVTVPFSFHIGLAVSHDGGRRFERYSQAPVLGRSHHDPFIVGAPWVLRENDRYRMWYTSCTEWSLTEGSNDKARHYYTIKHAESDDGITWETNERLCMPYQHDEYAFARPVVTHTERGYRMLFSYRFGDASYRVGSARSNDGLSWQRDDAAVILPHIEDGGSESAWDGSMACYACPLQTGAREILIYNGNDFGRMGFGTAYSAGT